MSASNAELDSQDALPPCARRNGNLEPPSSPSATEHETRPNAHHQRRNHRTSKQMQRKRVRTDRQYGTRPCASPRNRKNLTNWTIRKNRAVDTRARDVVEHTLRRVPGKKELRLFVGSVLEDTLEKTTEKKQLRLFVGTVDLLLLFRQN
jgi:hypothetical protein